MKVEMKGKSLYLTLAAILLTFGAVFAIYSAITAEMMDYSLLVLGVVQLALAIGLMLKYSIAYYGVLVLSLLAVLRGVLTGDLSDMNTLISIALDVAVLVLLILGSGMQTVTAKLPARVTGVNGYKFFRKLQ
jgi:hypothetical protein